MSAAENASLRVAQEICQDQYPQNLENCSITFSRMHGNCLACHFILGGTQPGNVGPPLLEMKTRFPKRSTLRMQIWDPETKNKNSIMPSFGKYQVLTEEQIDKVIDFIYTL
ncbi:Sulfur oxidation protein SoxX [uncultured Candidatus Thioglobus sp.]|nr:Sulfur oxidation protein SoxX [uncultured Candidatus Thioglobus sp.]